MIRPFLMGLETEYAVSCRSRRRRCTPEQLADWMALAAPNEFCAMRDLECPAGSYLANGGRLYTDIRGHPEYATPECFAPAQVAAHDMAGERIVWRVAQRVMRERRLKISVAKNNLGAVRPDHFTWGNHESYLSWVPLANTVAYLVPHLVTRLAYAGSGCLSARTDGFGFELSQRARHLRRVAGGDTTSSRAIFCTRVRKASDRSAQGWTRAHLIGKDSQRAPLGTYLTVGTTGLLFWMLNHGFAPPRLLELAEPVRALRSASLDPWHREKLLLADGRRLTALEIQECYLEDCEAFARHGPMPEWGAPVLRQWRGVLDALHEDPMRLAGKLDAYTKLAMYDSALSRARSSWADLRRGLALLTRLRHELPDGVVERLLRRAATFDVDGRRLAMTHAQAIVDDDGQGALERLQLALRLQVLDLKYHELGGAFDDITLTPRGAEGVLTDSDVEHAVASPPVGGRAARRGELIRMHHGEQGWAVSWQTVIPGAGEAALDLGDSFETREADVPIS